MPHASTWIPDDLRSGYLVSADELERELLAMTDHLTDSLFALPGAELLVYPVSRLVVDPERFAADESEPMARRGMGAVYTKGAAGRPIRNQPSAQERTALLDRFYHPHHRNLAGLVGGLLEKHSRCLIIDCHSFPSVAREYELDPEAPRPEIVLGTDAFHTPPELIAAARQAFEAAGFTTAINRPYAGTFVPSPFHNVDQRVLSVMVEVNRGIYLEESTAAPRPTFAQVQSRITAALTATLASLARNLR